MLTGYDLTTTDQSGQTRFCYSNKILHNLNNLYKHTVLFLVMVHVYQRSATVLFHIIFIIFTPDPKLMEQPLSGILFLMVAERREMRQTTAWFLRLPSASKTCHFCHISLLTSVIFSFLSLVGHRWLKLPHKGAH